MTSGKEDGHTETGPGPSPNQLPSNGPRPTAHTTWGWDNPALWRKTARDARRQLVASSVALILFGWLFVWLQSLFEPGVVVKLLDFLPKFVEPLIGIPLAKLATPVGRISVLYVHLITLLICIGWAVGRGSDVVSGEIGRGTMDFVATLPVQRHATVAVSAVVTGVGAAVLAMSVWIGSGLGLATVRFPEPVDLRIFLPGVLNLSAMTFCLAGLTAFCSSWDSSRWRTILVAGGLFAVCSVIKMVARLWEPGAWLRYFTFLTAFEPQKLILLEPERTGPLAWQYNVVLVGLGLLGYGVAAVVFSRRDLPAPY